MNHPFKPAINKRTKVLILGTFPSIESVKQKMYYGHRQNVFWKMIGEFIGRDLTKLAFRERPKHLLAKGIGVWDVVSSCSRKTSADSNLKNEKYIDFKKLKKDYPELKLIIFNSRFMQANKGRREIVDELHKIGFEYAFAPSTSPAYPMKYEDKKKEWFRILKKII